MNLNLLQNTVGCFQEIAGKTIESELFNALKLTRLIESRETSNYHRCGRTDRGVSAFRQVVSIDDRSNLIEGEGVFDYEGCRASERVQAQNGNQFSLSMFILIWWLPTIWPPNKLQMWVGFAVLSLEKGFWEMLASKIWLVKHLIAIFLSLRAMLGIANLKY